MAQDIVLKVVADTGQVDKELKDLNTSLEKTQKTVKGIGDSAEKSKKGLGLMKKGLKGIGTAMKAAGIGAIVAIFIALFEALKKNQKVMDAINVVMEAVSVVFNKVATAISDAVEKLKENKEAFDAIKTVVMNVIKLALTPFKLALLGIKAGILSFRIAVAKLKGDTETVSKLKDEFVKLKDEVIKLKDDTIASAIAIKDNVKAAANGIKDLTINIVDGIKDISVAASIEQSKALVNARKNLAGLNIELEKQKLIFQKNAELQRQIRDDETKTFEERIQANKDLGLILDEQAEAERKLINEKITLAELELSTNKDSQELIDNLAEAKLGLFELDERITGQRSEQLVNLVALEKESAQQIVDDKKAALDQTEQDQKDAYETKLDLEKAAADAKAKIDANIAMTEDAALNLFKENTIAYKAILLKRLFIDTKAAAVSVFNAFAPIAPPLGPILGAAAAGLVIANGVKIAGEIAGINFARGGVLNGPSHASGGILTPFGELEGGEGVINNASMSNPNLRNLASAANVAGGGVNFSTGDASINLSSSSISAIVNGINNKKVFVSETDITEAQNRVSVIEEDATL